MQSNSKYQPLFDYNFLSKSTLSALGYIALLHPSKNSFVHSTRLPNVTQYEYTPLLRQEPTLYKKHLDQIQNPESARRGDIGQMCKLNVGSVRAWNRVLLPSDGIAPAETWRAPAVRLNLESEQALG